MEYRYVTLPNGNVPRGASIEERATHELNALVQDGWEVVNTTRPQVIGPIGFLLKRP